MTRASSSRENYFYQRPGENTNVAPVVYGSEPPTSSVGWSDPDFFESLGDPRHAKGTTQRNAEQEYLLQGMVKGAMSEASRIAAKSGYGIAVRPTGVLAHMGIESGYPTKAQEVKNKTSKELDLFLCDELQWKDIGAVVHYNPRVRWSSQAAAAAARSWIGWIRISTPPATEQDWRRKRQYIETVRLPALKAQKLDARMRFWPDSEDDWKKLKDLFMNRAKEYDEEDREYRFGPYRSYVHLEGPYVRLKARPDANMIGDHDLFGFARAQRDTHMLIRDDALAAVQVDLQRSPDFQAQHGGIWYWEPSTQFNKGIKDKIMGAHSPPDGEPLLLFLPDRTVCAVFYIKGPETLESVWDHPGATRWLSQTFSGKSL